MPEMFLLSRAQMRRIKPLFPKPRGLPRVSDRRVISRIVYVILNRLQWKDAPAGCGPHKTLYNRFVRWSRRGVFERIFEALAGETRAGTGSADDRHDASEGAPHAGRPGN